MITRHLLKRETYGCLQDDPIERGNQGEYELREDIYKDMLELQERNAAGQLEFLSHKEVWSAGKEETYGSAD